jgi:hypothetical protein
LESSAGFFIQLDDFMKGRVTAAGAPSGGGGGSFRGCGGMPPLKSNDLWEIGKMMIWAFTEFWKETKRTRKFSISILLSCRLPDNYVRHSRIIY